MKWISLFPLLFLVACSSTPVSSEVVESKEVVATPEPKNAFELFKECNVMDVSEHSIIRY